MAGRAKTKGAVQFRLPGRPARSSSPAPRSAYPAPGTRCPPGLVELRYCLPGNRANTGLCDRVLQRLHGPALQDLARRLGLEHRRLLREGVDPLAGLGSGLFDDDEFRETWQHEHAVLLELVVPDRREGLEEPLYVFAGELGGVSVGDGLDQICLG